MAGLGPFGQAGSGASGPHPRPFGSLARRQARVELSSKPLPSGLEKVHNLQGLSELFSHMKEKFGTSASWASLMDCDAVYLKDIQTAVGLSGTRFGLFLSVNDTPSWSPDAGEAILTAGEKAALEAHAAKTERLYYSSARTSGLLRDIIDKNQVIKEKVKMIEDLEKKISDADEVKRRVVESLQKKHAEKYEHLVKKNYQLIVENMKLARELEKKEQEIEKLKVKPVQNGFKNLAIFVFVFVLLTGLFSTASAQQPEEQLKRMGFHEEWEIEESCQKPEFGCLLMDSWVPMPELDWSDFVSKCYNTRGNIITTQQFQPLELMVSCMRSVGNFLQREDLLSNKLWCERRMKSLIASKCNANSTFEQVTTQVLEALENARGFFNLMKFYHLDLVIVTIFSLVLAGTKEKAVAMLPLLFVCWYCKLPVFLITTAVHVFPLAAVPFLILQLWIPSSFVIWAFLLWLTLTLTGFFWNTGVGVLTEVSWAILYTVAFLIWSIALVVVESTNLTVAAQILIFAITTSIGAGTRYACATVTVTDWEGNTTKVTRIAKAKNVLASQASRMIGFLQSRGVIPASAVKCDSIVTVAGKGVTGTGFRFMNYIVTAGHVVRDTDFATLKFQNVAVKVKVYKRVTIFQCVDELVLFKLPKELQNIKPLKLAKSAESDYLTLHCWDANFQNPVSYTGWCVLDNIWLNNSFDTKFGQSGAPYTNQHGHLVGFHLGSQGVLSQGVVIIDLLKRILDGDDITTFGPAPVVQQCAEVNIDSIVERLIEATKISHGVILKQLEEMQEKVLALEKKQLEIIDAQLVAHFEQKKKGKTKHTIRGARQNQKKFLTRGHFYKMKMLTDEEYNEMLEKGFSPEEIKEAVDGLREQAWMNYCIDNDLDFEDDEIEEDIRYTDAINEQIDQQIERAMEDRGEFFDQCKRLTFVQQAQLLIITMKKGETVVVKQKVPAILESELVKNFNKSVTSEELPEGETSVAVLTTEAGVEVKENKKVNLDKIKHIKLDEEKKEQEILGDTKTQVSIDSDNNASVLKIKKLLDVDKPQIQPLEQRKRTCRWCGSVKPHDFKKCRVMNEECFCVFCATKHSTYQGHSREIKCNICGLGCKTIEELENHVMKASCKKN
nr:non-structural polyprotein [Duck astrovirus]